ncbi:hypothetical protein [Brasilonema bromeliae]|uniref:Uncharacterized protein n=1 Tax=Brasilonema bromeliae SPC951 TaxID=385972 RepID=A0ABX1P951_9CYAN|nr:hypothetical protein [Brasilonema bromeliae]NMG20332.1 hypothetical protein [Brasilonema bromeliae SPC951]
MNVVFLAQLAVNFFLGKALEGALQSIGSDAYKASIERLRGFFQWKFAGKPELTQAIENPKALEALVEKKATEEEDFRKELEKLVAELQEAIKNTSASGTNYNNVGSITEQDIESVSGVNAGHNTVTGHQTNVGGNQTNHNFRT